MLCPGCDGAPESISHALIECEVAKRVWSCWKDCPANLLTNHWDVSDSTLEIIVAGTSSDLEAFFVAAWAIWYNRNQIVFESTCQLPQHIWNFAMGYLRDFKENGRNQHKHRTTESRKWEAPPSGVFKINVDGATSKQGRNSGVGVVIRNSEGKIIEAWSKYLAGLFLVMEVEMLAIKPGILLAKEMKISNIIIESDALAAIQSLEKGEIGGCLGHLVHGIFLILKDFNSWSLNHVKRNYNRVAHELA